MSSLVKIIEKYMFSFNLCQHYSFQERIHLSVPAYPLQVHWSSSWSDLWHFHDCFFDPNQSIHFGSPVFSNWLCAGTFRSVAKVFVRKQNLEKKSPFVTLPSYQHDCLASDCSFLSKWKEQESTGGFLNFKQFSL